MLRAAITDRSTWIIAAALTLLTLGPWLRVAAAATYYVAKDGTGQFSVIQDALDAAAPGDTIRIGAGRYDEFRDFGSVVMHVQAPDLTIIGAGRDSVVIGPTEIADEIEGNPTIGMFVPGGASGCDLSGVTLENMQAGVSLVEAARLSDLTIRNMSEGMVNLLGTDGAVVEDTVFEWMSGGFGPVNGVSSFAGDLNPNTLVQRCSFSGIGVESNGLTIVGGNGSRIRDCEFENVNVAVWLIDSDSVRVERCGFVQTGVRAFTTWDCSDLTIEDCDFDELQYRGIELTSGSTRIDRTRINGGSLGAITLLGGIDLVMRDCDILSDVGPHVYSEASSEFSTQIDLRYNFWGSTDSAEIASWIDDGADDGPGDCELFSYCPRDTVDFWPVLDRSVPVKPESLGGLKGRFRTPRPSDNRH
ncbi:hypothetical protein DRQ53_12995 [bacterium]|nr:MAG: hypothetical protein DRQ53_12995 [bacterium]